MPCTAKKTTQLIVERGNDDVITVKGNQPRRFQHLQAASVENQPALRFSDVEKTRNRFTCRIISVFDDIRNLDGDWSGVKSLVQVDPIGIRDWAAVPTNQLLHQFFSCLSCPICSLDSWTLGD